MSQMFTGQLTQNSTCPGPQSHRTPTKAPSQEAASRTGSPPCTDWWLLSPGSLTHCPGLSLGPDKSRELEREPLRVTRARLARRGGITAKPRFMGPIIIMKERKKKGTRVRQCPGTRTAALLPKMSSLSTLQISIKHAVLHSFACHLHANDLTPQCTQSPKRLLVLAFLPALLIVLH